MASRSSSPEVTAMALAAPPPQSKKVPSEYILRKYLLMLATLVATVTYGAWFNPPGGIWQDSVDGHLAGEPIVQNTNNLRYLVFFYCNSFALASSVLVIVLFLLLSIDLVDKKEVWVRIKPLRVLMVLDLLSFMGAYAAGSCRDMLTTVYTWVLMVAGVCTYLAVQVTLAWGSGRPLSPPLPGPADQGEITVSLEERLRKMLMLLATFALSITYVSGLNSPGGFWDSAGGGHHPGDAILNDGHHKARLATFFICNTTVFMASLLIIMLLLGRKLHERTTVRSREMLGCVLVALVGLVGAYAAGSSRDPAATACVVILVVAATLACVLLQSWCRQQAQDNYSSRQPPPSTEIANTVHSVELQLQGRRSRSLLLLLATFATAITYPAGLDPPGGVWQQNGYGHLAGDPILVTTNAIRYRIFFYCNSVAFISSFVTIILFMLRGYVLRAHVVETVMILELFGLTGAYAAGACREVSTSIYVMALGGAVLFYVVIHVIFFTLEQKGMVSYVEQAEVEKKRKLLYLLATLSTAMSYQAGLAPPGGFWLQQDDKGSGDPVLLYNHPRRYNAFFYCNSLSFMLSVTTMILLVSPVLYRPAIQSHALTLCTAAGLSCLLGAYAAGSTQQLSTSIGIFVLVAAAFMILLALLLILLVRDSRLRRAAKLVRWSEPHEDGAIPMINAQGGDLILNSEEQEKKDQQHAQRKHMMLLGILVAGVTYQAGLDPPGGVWQQDDDAGGPVMLDNRRHRYLAFFYGNSTSFLASIVIILLLLLQWLTRLKMKQRLHFWVMLSVLLLDLLALLVAYAAGSCRDWKSSVVVAVLIIPAMACVVIKVVFTLP